MTNKRKNEHYVYKFVYNNEILYIGKIDSNLQQRICTHFSSGKFDEYKGVEVYCEKLNNSLDTKYMEVLLINKYKPILNKAEKSKDKLSFDFDEPTWEKYEDYLDIVDETPDYRTNWDLKLNDVAYDSLVKLGDNIKKARLRRDWSAEFLSKSIGMSRATLWKIESGNPDVSIGYYIIALNALNASNEIADICKDEKMILEMDSKLLSKRRATKRCS